MRFDAFFCRARRSEPQICRAARERIGAAGLTMRQRSSAFWTDPEQPKGVFINSKPRRGLLSGAVRLR
jgi:hypothetical protein